MQNNLKKQIHILNGDSLKQQFPAQITGEVIVARECLVDGNVQGNNLEELFATRAKFLSQNYGGTEAAYYEKTASEFLKIIAVSGNADINLWFEDDLFCQVNFWFVVNLLVNQEKQSPIFLVRPEKHNQYGFGGLTEPELNSIYENKISLSKLHKISSLWESYQNGDTEKLIKTAEELESKYPFILQAVNAHIQRIPVNGNSGRPIQSLITIMEELDTEEFGPVFKEFNKRESIYGFGDVIVKRLYDELRKNR